MSRKTVSSGKEFARRYPDVTQLSPMAKHAVIDDALGGPVIGEIDSNAMHFATTITGPNGWATLHFWDHRERARSGNRIAFGVRLCEHVRIWHSTIVTAYAYFLVEHAYPEELSALGRMAKAVALEIAKKERAELAPGALQ